MTMYQASVWKGKVLFDKEEDVEYIDGVGGRRCLRELGWRKTKTAALKAAQNHELIAITSLQKRIDQHHKNWTKLLLAIEAEQRGKQEALEGGTEAGRGRKFRK